MRTLRNYINYHRFNDDFRFKPEHLCTGTNGFAVNMAKDTDGMTTAEVIELFEIENEKEFVITDFTLSRTIHVTNCPEKVEKAKAIGREKGLVVT